MYQYIFDETTTKDIKNNTANSKNILEQFADVDNKYTFGNPVDIGLNLQKDNYVAPSQEEVKNKAKNSLESYKNERYIKWVKNNKTIKIKELILIIPNIVLFFNFKFSI